MPICLLSLEHIPTAVIQAPENFPTWKGMVVNLIRKDLLGESQFFNSAPMSFSLFDRNSTDGSLSNKRVLRAKFWGNVFSQNK